MSEQNNVGLELKEYFKERGITQEEIARQVGSTQQVVGRLLNGKPFGKKTAATWSETFGFNPAWLITGDGARFLSDKERELNTAKKVVDMGSQVFAEQLLQMINEGTIYPASVMKEKNAELQRKDAIIEELNRQIGTLRQKIAQLEGRK